MQNALKKFFYNEKVLFIMPWVYIVCAMLYCYAGMKCDENYETFRLADAMLKGVIALFIVAAYQRHEKNIMKGLLGAVLMDCLLNALYGAMHYIDIAGSAGNVVCSLLYLAGYLLLFTNHFVLAAGHQAKPATVKTNQIATIAIVAVVIVWKACGFDFNGSVFYSVFSVVFDAAILGMVISIESKIDAYKTAREANGYVAK